MLSSGTVYVKAAQGLCYRLFLILSSQGQKQQPLPNMTQVFSLQSNRPLFMDSHSILQHEGMQTHTYTPMESGLNQSYVQKAGGYSRETTVNYKNTF